MSLSHVVRCQSAQSGLTAGGLPIERLVLIPERIDTAAAGGVHPDGAILASAFGDAVGQLKAGARYRLTLTLEPT